LDLKTLAARLNLSPSTVSRALNGYADVNAETRSRVVEAAAALGYHPSATARRLRVSRAESIGVLLTPPQSRFADPFYLDLLTGIDDALTGTRYHLLATAAKSKDDEMEKIRRLVAGRQVDGLIFARTETEDARIAFLQDKGVPFATLGRSRAVRPFAYVEIDHTMVGREAVARLTALGHRRIALINTPGRLSYSVYCETGFREALVRGGAPVRDDYVVAAEPTRAGGERAAAGLMALDEPPTAIVCGNDVMAFGAMDHLQAAGLRIGADVAVIGCDDHPFAAFSTPPLTTFRAPVREAGAALARTLLRVIDGEDPAALGQVWDLSLVARESDRPAGTPASEAASG